MIITSVKISYVDINSYMCICFLNTQIIMHNTYCSLSCSFHLAIHQRIFALSFFFFWFPAQRAIRRASSVWWPACGSGLLHWQQTRCQVQFRLSLKSSQPGKNRDATENLRTLQNRKLGEVEGKEEDGFCFKECCVELTAKREILWTQSCKMKIHWFLCLPS